MEQLHCGPIINSRDTKTKIPSTIKDSEVCVITHSYLPKNKNQTPFLSSLSVTFCLKFFSSSTCSVCFGDELLRKYLNRSIQIKFIDCNTNKDKTIFDKHKPNYKPETHKYFCRARTSSIRTHLKTLSNTNKR